MRGRQKRLAATAGAAERVGNVPLAAFTWEKAACAAAAVGDRDGARDHGEAALAHCRGMGAVAGIDRVLARMRALGVRRGPRERHRTATSGPASLTPTERRVAALVGDGLTNPHIAAQLWVSPRKVQTRVSTS